MTVICCWLSFVGCRVLTVQMIVGRRCRRLFFVPGCRVSVVDCLCRLSVVDCLCRVSVIDCLYRLSVVDCLCRLSVVDCLCRLSVSYLAGMSPYISLKIKKRHYEHHMIEAHKYLITWISDDIFLK